MAVGICYVYFLFPTTHKIYTVSSSFEVTRDEANAAYRAFVAKIPPGDKEAHELTFKPIVDYCESLKTSHSERQGSTKSIVTRMHQAKAVDPVAIFNYDIVITRKACWIFPLQLEGR
jgi:hypothetical protein